MKNQKVPVFVYTLYELLNDENYRSLLEWTSDGNSFCIKDIKGFDEIMRYHFKSSSLGSFFRQLNLYNFTRLSDSRRKEFRLSNKAQFQHQYFSRDNPDEMVNIRRQKLKRNNIKEIEMSLTIVEKDHIKEEQKEPPLKLPNQAFETFPVFVSAVQLPAESHTFDQPLYIHLRNYQQLYMPPMGCNLNCYYGHQPFNSYLDNSNLNFNPNTSNYQSNYSRHSLSQDSYSPDAYSFTTNYNNNLTVLNQRGIYSDLRLPFHQSMSYNS